MSNSGYFQDQRQTQGQVFAPQLRQSLKILQLPALELRDALLEELETNPVLEEMPMDSVSIEREGQESSKSNDDDNFEKTSDQQDGPEELEFKDDFEVLEKLDEDWQDYYQLQREAVEYTGDQAQRRQHFLDSVVMVGSLQDHLTSQIDLLDCDPEQRKLLEYMVGGLDDKGFLTSDFEEISKATKKKREAVVQAHQIFKQLEPAGIGARDVQESLKMQLESIGKETDLAWIILDKHYKLLLRNRIPEIAKEEKVSQEDVQNALLEIAALDPAPGRKFEEDTNNIVLPDVSVEKLGEDWVVSLNSDYIPRLRLSRAYKDLMRKEEVSKKERDYIRDKMRAGKYVISAIEQRQKTLERISNVIIQLQQPYFESGVSKLKPMTMGAVAEQLKLHETTISRAIANKFIETPHGVVPMKFFFTFGFESQDGEEGSVSNRAVKDEINKIIQAESPTKPLSDQKIVDILKEQGMKIARRTVAKYREELGIPATSLRKQYK